MVNPSPRVNPWAAGTSDSKGSSGHSATGATLREVNHVAIVPIDQVLESEQVNAVGHENDMTVGKEQVSATRVGRHDRRIAVELIHVPALMISLIQPVEDCRGVVAAL